MSGSLENGLALVAGLFLLYVGAEGLVRGATRLARSLGVSGLVVGLTVVAFGTSTPELVVSTLSAFRGRADVALGNVVGSNIVNIGLILGLSATVYPLRVELRLVRREIPVVIGVSLLLLGLLWDGSLGRLDAGLLLAAFGAYLAFVLLTAQNPPTDAEAAYRDFEDAPLPFEPPATRRVPALGLVLIGLAGLVLGAHLLVESSVWFARQLGMPELVIGLTVVAAGTSLPELATSVVAAIRRTPDIAVGNVVGSNIFNILAILGVAGLVRPLEAAPALLRLDGPVMLAAAVLLLPLAWTRFRLERWEGALLLIGYGGYLVALFLTATGG